MGSKKPDGIGPDPTGFDALEEGSWSEFLMGIRETTESLGKGLGWDEDWMPVVIVDGTFPADLPDVEPDLVGKTGRLIVGFAGDMMRDDESKDYLAAIMGMLAIKTLATGMVFLSTVWMSVLPMTKADDNPDETEEEHRERIQEEARLHGPPSKDPNRKERLMILSVQYSGEDDGTKFIFASIKREEGKPPVLYDWKLCDSSSMGMLGRFPDAIYMGLKLAGMMRDAKGNAENEGEEWKEGK